MRAAVAAAGLSFALLVIACSSNQPPQPAPAEPPKLQPPETFNWTGEKISFAIPPVGWRREGETGGGIKGARFVRDGSPEAIGLGDYYVLADRNRSSHIQELLAAFDTYEYGSLAWDKALRDTYAYTDTPFSALETEIAEQVNTEIGQASVAWRNRDREGAKAHLEAALAASGRLHFSLDDAIGRVEFKLEGRQNPEWYRLVGRRNTVIASEPAVVVDYTVSVPERAQSYSGREAYFVHNSHMFIATFIGFPGSVAVLDAILASTQFPQ